MKIAFTDQRAFLANFNGRSELNGDERAPAADLKITLDLPNDILDALQPGLKGRLYHFDAERPLDLADQGKQGDEGYLPHLTLPDLESPLKWKSEMTGCRVVIANGQRQIVLQDCKVNAVQFEPRDGGTVHLQIRVQCHPDEGAGGTLFTWIQQEIQLTLAGLDQ